MSVAEQVAARQAAREAEARQVSAACPGWRTWPNSPYMGGVTWSAMPDGAPAAVLTGMALSEVPAMVRAYEKRLRWHLAGQRARLAEQEARSSGVAAAEAAQTRALIAALETLAARG